MKVLITGNARYGLSAELAKRLPGATLVSRSNGYDLTDRKDQDRCADLALSHDAFINCAALWRFNQALLMDAVYQKCATIGHGIHIIAVGSTVDRSKNGKPWLYGAEKKALRDWCNTLSMSGVWGNTPKVTYASFGTMSNNQHKHPDRRCLDIGAAADYVVWLLSQPRNVNINEISIDPMQDGKWYD